MATTLCLNGHLWGDESDSNFTITIAQDANLDDLKDQVKAKNDIDFLYTKASNIRLLKLKVPSRPNEVVPVNFDNNTEELKNLFETISNLFGAPSPGHVHFIVLPPNAKLVSLYVKAWGKEWPQHPGTILRTDVVPAPVLDEDDSSAIDIPKKFEYTCFDDMKQVNAALRISTALRVLVVFQEYKNLREMMEDAPEQVGIVVTGQPPGIGKSAFIQYLLLHRLENKLPTAVQFGANNYIILDEHGAKEVATVIHDDRLTKCWGLVNSDPDIIMPCLPFQTAPQKVIQVSSPNLETWPKQPIATVIDMELPKMEEVLAIAKEVNFPVSYAFDLVNKWGPSVRTIMETMLSQDPQAREASLAAIARRKEFLSKAVKGRDNGFAGGDDVFVHLGNIPGPSGPMWADEGGFGQ